MNEDHELNKSVKEAETIAKDPRAVELLADKAQKKARAHSKMFQKIGKDVRGRVESIRILVSDRF